MKKRLTSFALSAFFGVGLTLAAPVAQDQSAPPANNQETGHHRADPNRQLRSMSKHLNLTADQQNQILPILTDRQQQVSGILSDNSLSKKDRRAKMQSVREDSENKIKAVLTDTQKQQYGQMLQQMHDRAHERRCQHQNGAQGTPDNS
jgi:Spy/CpxP family protein refolding chaperone